MAQLEIKEGVFLPLDKYNKLIEGQTTSKMCPRCKGSGNEFANSFGQESGCATCRSHGWLVIPGKVDLPYRHTGMTMNAYFKMLNKE